MTPKDVQETIAAMRAVRKQYTKSPEVARRFLVEAGFLNEDGTLAAPYADEEDGEETQTTASGGKRKPRSRGAA